MFIANSTGATLDIVTTAAVDLAFGTGYNIVSSSIYAAVTYDTSSDCKTSSQAADAIKKAVVVHKNHNINRGGYYAQTK